ncbi:MAG TPA: hypothetical protein VFG49_18160 [Dyella sp.]|uniref:hypothetical protein n=1 Tax=Dyella sp. TaxID=1869338 RepID=UPI002D78EB13|nr:hypothetical protein [Dyella sp.]HET6555458.1 hypothetical protein [Dyella sp.]
MRLARLLPLSLSVALAIPALALAADQYVPLQQRMTPEEFKAAGLDKLSADELKNLDTWLSGHGKVVTKMVDAGGKPVFYPDSEKRTAVEAKLKGSFEGFSGHGQYELDNGQTWKQADATSHACPQIDNPKVKIKPSLFGNWLMYVEDCNDSVSVKRVH